MAKKCTYDPTALRGPIGMFHCPECGEMQLAGLPHLPSVESEMKQLQEQDIEMLEIVLRNKQHTNVYADYEFSAIQRLLDRIRELEQQRDAALKLGDEWEAEAKDTSKSNTVRFTFYGCADELRAIFEPKEGK